MNKTLKTIIYIAAVIIIVAVTMALKAFVFGNYTVKGDSMNDTLSDGDVVWAAKLASPDYGDIILVMDDDTNLVKRAVGFAGDRLWMERDDSEPGSKWYLCRKKSGSDEIERLAEERYGDSVMPRFDLEIETCHLITKSAKVRLTSKLPLSCPKTAFSPWATTATSAATAVRGARFLWRT